METFDDASLTDSNETLYPVSDFMKIEPEEKRELTELCNARLNHGRIYSDVQLGGYPVHMGAYEKSWQSKHPRTWDQIDVTFWLQDLTDNHPQLVLQPGAFSNCMGEDLIQMTTADLYSHDSQFWQIIHESLQKELCKYSPYYQSALTFPEPYQDATDFGVQSENMTSMEKLMHMYELSGSDTLASLQLPPIASLQRRGPPHAEHVTVKEETRTHLETPPPSPTCSDASTSSQKSCGKKNGRTKGKLWEFIRDLLLNSETNPSIIKWEDRSKGVFRIVKSDKVAGLWGKRKGNSTMTYEKMSRAMRYYYKKRILERIDGRRLVYKFGCTSRGWQI